VIHIFSVVTRCADSSHGCVGPRNFAKAEWKGFEMTWVALFRVFPWQLEVRLKCGVSCPGQLWTGRLVGAQLRYQIAALSIWLGSLRGWDLLCHWWLVSFRGFWFFLANPLSILEIFTSWIFPNVRWAILYIYGNWRARNHHWGARWRWTVNILEWQFKWYYLFNNDDQ